MTAYSMDDLDEYYYSGNYAMAYLAVQELVKESPQSAEMHVMWAELEMKVNNNLVKAEALLSKADRLGPSDDFIFFYHSVRGHLMLEKGEYKEAIEAYEQSVKIKPWVGNLTRLGQALSACDEERAVDVWREVLEKDSGNCLAHIFLAKEAEKNARADEALVFVKKAESLSPSREELFEIGRVYHDLDDYEKAIEAYHKADMVGYEDRGDLYSATASCYLAIGDSKTALKFARRAIELDPDNGYAREVLEACRDITEGEY